MPSNEELRAEIAKLKRQRDEGLRAKRKRLEMIKDAKRKISETAKLKKELSELKNPKSSAFKRNLKRFGRFGGKAVLLAGEDIDKRLRPKARARKTIPQGIIQFRKTPKGYHIFIAGKSFEFAKTKKILLIKVNMIRRLQGKSKIAKI